MEENVSGAITASTKERETLIFKKLTNRVQDEETALRESKTLAGILVLS